MSLKLLEYLKMIKAGLENPEQVLEGMMNDVKLENGSLSPKEQEEILRRRVICAGCEFMSENAKAAGQYFTKRKEEHCTICLCPIKTKTASLTSSCGLTKWNRKNPDNQIPLKWEAYDENKNQETKDNE